MTQLERFQQELNEYAGNVLQIRVLSAVLIDRDTGAEHYSQHLREDYKEIGRLGVRCREILKDTLYPVLRREEPIDPEYLPVLQDFCAELLEPASGEELDLSLLFEISSRLAAEFKRNGDERNYVRQLHTHINVCYANVNRTARVIASPELCTFYRDAGLEAARVLKGYFYDRERFIALDEESRRHVTLGVRFYSALYDTFFADKETNIARYQALVDAIEACDNEFYKNALPHYDWKRQKFRCIEHMGQLTERGNRWGFTKEECGEICEYIRLYEELWEEDPETARSYISESHFRLIVLRNKYFAGRIDKTEYQKGLLELYDTWSNNLYDMPLSSLTC